MIGFGDLAKIALTAGLAAELAQLGVPGQWRAQHELVGKETGIDPDLLHAFQLQENYQGNAAAVSPANENGTKDHGLMQINDVNFPKLHLTTLTVYDALTNIRAAAELLKWNMAAAPHLGTLAQMSIYNAGFSSHRDADGRLRAKTNTNGTFFNQKYVVACATWYALIKLAAIAPIKTTGWVARA